jgi:hypothetical protein
MLRANTCVFASVYRIMLQAVGTTFHRHCGLVGLARELDGHGVFIQMPKVNVGRPCLYLDWSQRH